MLPMEPGLDSVTFRASTCSLICIRRGKLLQARLSCNNNISSICVCVRQTYCYMCVSIDAAALPGCAHAPCRRTKALYNKRLFMDGSKRCFSCAGRTCPSRTITSSSLTPAGSTVPSVSSDVPWFAAFSITLHRRALEFR